MFKLLQFRETKSRNNKPKFVLNSETSSTFEVMRPSSFYSNVFLRRAAKTLFLSCKSIINRDGAKKNFWKIRFLFKMIFKNLTFLLVVVGI